MIGEDRRPGERGRPARIARSAAPAPPPEDRGRMAHGRHARPGILAAVIAVGVVLTGMILYLARSMDELRRDVTRDIADLWEGMARIGGPFAGFTARNAMARPSRRPPSRRVSPNRTSPASPAAGRRHP